MKQHATVRWEGGLRNGGGYISTESGSLMHAPYGFKTRFEGQRGTNPEELIAAAHAACFSMALSKELADKGITADTIETKAEVALEQQGEGFAITKSDLTLRAVVPDCSEEQFQEAARRAKEGCPVSKLLNAPINLTARLIGRSERWEGEQPHA